MDWIRFNGCVVINNPPIDMQLLFFWLLVNMVVASVSCLIPLPLSQLQSGKGRVELKVCKRFVKLFNVKIGLKTIL
ncbi:hypothetical protein D3C74_466910 [compost metagenome]